MLVPLLESVHQKCQDRPQPQRLKDAGELGVTLVVMPASFPDPTAAAMNETFRRLRNVAIDCHIIRDGLAFGALEPDGVKNLQAPIVALIV